VPQLVARQLSRLWAAQAIRTTTESRIAHTKGLLVAASGWALGTGRALEEEEAVCV